MAGYPDPSRHATIGTMGQLLLVLVGALTVAAVIFGVVVLVTGGDPGLVPAEPDGRAVPLPVNRPLREEDVTHVRFDTGLRGYRMDQVDRAMTRAAYDIGYKTELIGVLEAEVSALRDGRTADADMLRDAREAAAVSTRSTDAATATATAMASTEVSPAGSTSPAVAGPSDATAGPVETTADQEDRRTVAPDMALPDVATVDPFTRTTVDLPTDPVRSERP